MSKPVRILLIILAAVGLGLFAMQFEWVEVSERTGYKEEVIRNPYHAGMLLLRSVGVPAERSRKAPAFDSLATHSTLLLAHPAAYDSPQQAKPVLDWVARGGHLVLPIDGHQPPHALLKPLHISIAGWNATQSPQQLIHLEDEPLTIEMMGATVFDTTKPVWEAVLSGVHENWGAPPGAPAADNEDEDEDTATPPDAPKNTKFRTDPIPFDAQHPVQRVRHAVFARIQYGQGTVTVGNFQSFQNPHIEASDHATALIHLMTLPHDPRPVLISLSADYPGLLVWLLDHAGEAVLAGLLLIFASLWRVAPRFGPAHRVAPPHRPGLLEHLRAVGDFMLREKQYEALLAPLRDDVTHLLTQLQSRHPELDDLPTLGARISGLSLNEVQLALSAHPPDHHDFHRRSQTLAQLRRHCMSMHQSEHA